MSATKVMIVDDSFFSRTLIAETLQLGGCEVVGEADSFDSLIETYNDCKPDIVTMDIVMPGTDGFECSRSLLMNDPSAKIILVSSMKDEETEAEAKRIGIAGYVQKPVDGEYLLNVIKNILSPDTLYEQLIELAPETFNEAISQNITRMAKTPVSFEPMETFDVNYVSKGITTVIGIIGRYSGSMILDLSLETAEQIVEALLHRPSKNREEVIAMVAELANIIAGVACSMLNKKDKTFGLRVSPPSVFFNSSSEIASPNLKMQSSLAQTSFGPILLGIGFKKGAASWI
ncbi:response regulator containing a CheY-like receiver domain and an HTH DNA-binding domain [Desulfosporosinus acidiphilus SJ4]|uniref:Stage 0 sporulation protein A homolog n=1 Tax=Desulfosporosinus acidiphilus (strain DSM 22704 / JCM 16185 / SJ4) TaxID=646529 RepID=I4D1J7_DESAJ|nr:response regulator [Desulfosporosinus acidiphilus]AFM39671.1 response regulator containing a CheY-like receiver domain and an HTH DNA-binding domain [Desulfosporosinus acidiphilus SJ4]